MSDKAEWVLVTLPRKVTWKSTISPKGIVQFWSCHKAVANVFPLKAEPSSATRTGRGAFDSAKNHKRQRRKRQSVTAKREKSQTPKFE